MTSERRFPVLLSQHTREETDLLKRLGCPRSVPWSLLAPHEEQALRNHDQTLQRLAERGGLCPKEMVAVLTDRPWRDVRALSLEESVRHLLAAVATHDE